MYSLHFSLQFASGKIVQLIDGDRDLEGIFPKGPSIERLKYKGELFTGALLCLDLDWTLDFVDGQEHGYFRIYIDDFLLSEYRYAFGVQWGIGLERNEHLGVITEETFDFGPALDHFDAYALTAGYGSPPIRVDFNDPFIQIQDASEPSEAPDCLFYRGRPFTGILVQRSDDGDWVEIEYYLGFVRGICRAYHPNGQLKTELFYKYDRPIGTQYTWDIFGAKVSQKEHGEPAFYSKYVYGRIWNSQGDNSRRKPLDEKWSWFLSMLQQ